MPDELVDFYAFIFYQGGFRHLGMTFEQFLLVVATVNPRRLRDIRLLGRSLPIAKQGLSLIALSRSIRTALMRN